MNFYDHDVFETAFYRARASGDEIRKICPLHQRKTYRECDVLDGVICVRCPNGLSINNMPKTIEKAREQIYGFMLARVLEALVDDINS